MIESLRPEDFDATAKSAGFPDGATAMALLEAAGRLTKGGFLGNADIEALHRLDPATPLEGLRQFVNEINAMPKEQKFQRFVGVFPIPTEE